MPGSIIPTGTTPTVPDIYFTLPPVVDTNAGDTGVVASLFTADDGPLAAWKSITGIQQLYDLYGTLRGVETAAEALRGGADEVFCYRVGTGGTTANKTIQDTGGTPQNALVLTKVNPGIRNLAFTNDDSDDDPTNFRELILYRPQTDGTFLELFRARYAKGGTGTGEPALAAAALAAQGYVTAAVPGGYTGNKILAAFTTPTLLTAGTNPTEDSAAYLAGAYSSEGIICNTQAFDTTDATIKAALAEWARGLDAKGVFRIIFLAHARTVTASLQTRIDTATGIGMWNTALAAHEFRRRNPVPGGAPILVAGGAFAGRMAGMAAAYDLEASLAGAVIPDAVDIPYPATADEVKSAIAKGAIVLRTNSLKQVTVNSGLTTYQTQTDPSHTIRWGKILRTMRRYRFLADLTRLLEPLKGVINNDEDGLGEAVGRSQGLLNDYVDAHYFRAGSVLINPEQPPEDDLAALAVYITDNDVTERLIVAINLP